MPTRQFSQRSERSKSHPPPISRPHQPPCSLNLQVPSLHDGQPLDARLFVPDYHHRKIPFRRKAAVIAHPYAPLGGCCDDPVVSQITSLLVSHGWVVAIFNFRGAAQSKGRTSWTGKPEISDYTAVATWLLSFITTLPEPPADAEPRPPPSSPSPTEVTLCLAGYSYGALITAHLPPTSKLQTYLSAPPTREFATVLNASRASARRWWDAHDVATRTSYSSARPRLSGVFVHEGTTVMATISSSKTTSATEPDEPHVTTWYLLISPPLAPVSGFLIASVPSFWGSKTQSGPTLMEPGTAKARGTEVLAVWGTEDMFTGCKKYRRWSEKMADPSFRGVEVDGAGHFWVEDGAIVRLSRVVLEWIGV